MAMPSRYPYLQQPPCPLCGSRNTIEIVLGDYGEDLYCLECLHKWRGRQRPIGAPPNTDRSPDSD
jgi:hypothetical protein